MASRPSPGKAPGCGWTWSGSRPPAPGRSAAPTYTAWPKPGWTQPARPRRPASSTWSGATCFIVCDEPISALDVSIQAQIINLLERLQDQLNLTYLFIAHHLSVVKHISDRIAVMYVGKIVEVSPARELYRRPRHPYTGSLLSAIPIPDPVVERGRKRIILKGDIASPVNPPSGCRFRTRCFNAQPDCAESEPPLETVTDGDHRAACYHPLD
jgi:oligopeptide/dipeptide ABC transporter ATP-binding protein